MSPAVRPPAVAGFFYPAVAGELQRDVREYLAAAEPLAPRPEALIAPHAGYRYSGPIAGSAYAGLGEFAGAIDRVVLIGPSHRVAFRGLALPEADAFRTPLGVVAVDVDAVRELARFPFVVLLDAAHEDEHSLEVHLPFLQETLGEFRIVPVVVGDAEPEETARVIEAMWEEPGTLVVVSSDLSHYHDAATAQQLDRATAERIEALEPVNSDGACGYGPVNGLVAAARRRGLHVRRLDLRNSSETAGTPDRVVGYGAWAFLA